MGHVYNFSLLMSPHGFGGVGWQSPSFFLLLFSAHYDLCAFFWSWREVGGEEKGREQFEMSARNKDHVNPTDPHRVRQQFLHKKII